MRRLILIGLLASPLPLRSQVIIHPGTPRQDVVVALGPPLLERSVGEVSYLFYRNGCERTCGMNDVVILRKGLVVDAIFRSAERRFAGTSSSPRAIPAAEARNGTATPSPAAPPAAAPATAPPAQAPPAKVPPPATDGSTPLVLPLTIKAVKKVPSS